MTRTLGWLLMAGTLFIGDAAAQQPLSKILSSEIAISRERAEIQLELEDGRKLTLATIAGAGATPLQRTVSASGDQILTLGVQRGDAVDRSWRDLLNNAIEASPENLATMLRDWRAPNARGTQLDAALDEVLLATGAPAAPLAPAVPVAPGVIDDSVGKLENKIEELEEQLDEAREHAIHARNARRGPDWLSPFRRVWQGIEGIFGVVITMTVLFGIGFVAILFGARKYLEGVADTVRAGVGRSFVVGLAGTFLLIPVFVLGIIALAISIVGIPALIVWIPLFPMGALAAAVLGYLGVAHAAGESWAERNYYGSDWFRRGNSYYFLMTGLMLLVSLFIAANIVHMAGPWLGFINGLLNFFGIILTWGAVTVGFGAVLISRGGSRTASTANAEQSSLFTEDANV
jgi:hypothetical protein